MLIRNHINNNIHIRLYDCVNENLLILDALNGEKHDEFTRRLVSECLEAVPILEMYKEALA